VTAVKLPDEKICRVRAEDDLLFKCLVTNSKDCKHAGFLNEDAYCLHSSRREILARSQARPAD